MNDETLHSADSTSIDRFRRAWREAQRPDLSDYLPPRPDPRFRATLEELVCVDLEFTLPSAPVADETGVSQIESYLSRFPELADPRVLRQLIRSAALVLRQRGISVPFSTFEQRFPGVVHASDLEDRPTSEKPGQTIALGTTIGPYRLADKLGEGGFGVVYLAEQTVPVRRQVALKVIRPGMDSSAVVARFEAERQALALMDHESIARVLDAGTTQDGLPFFVMELVRGEPITQYCDRHRLTTGQRIELFIQVCRAIQHAHQKGVIHRDIKPSNILVTTQESQPHPKVIDFGIAKALEQPLTERTLFTQYGQIIGTPQYMSPEQAQANALDVDTRSDVYCLGVLLYELLTGTTPIPVENFRRAAFDEMLRLIREGAHPKPSTRISKSGDAITGISENRQIEPRRLGPLVRGDLDWIVMKALEKDRTRRYETASAFADDLRRHLEDEPVLAGPPSASYRFRKYAKKYRAAILTAAGVTLLLVAATITSTAFFIRANRARAAEQTARKNAERAEAEAMQQAEVATAVTEFLTDDVLSQADPSASPDRDIKLRTVLDVAAGEVKSRFEDKPAVEAAVRFAIGNSYLGLGEYRQAEEHLQKSSQLREGLLGLDAAETLMSRNSLANVLFSRGQVDEAKQTIQDTLARQRVVLGEAHEDSITSMNDLASIHATQGQYDEAESLFKRALDLGRDSLGAEHRVTQAITLHLTDLYQLQGRYDEAEPLLRESLRRLEKSVGEEHPLALKSLHHLASLLARKGQLKDSEPLFEQAIGRCEQALGADHPYTMEVRSDLCVLYDLQGKLAQSESLVRDILAARKRVLGPEHYLTIMSMNDLATTLYRQGKTTASAEQFAQTLSLSEKVRGDEHPFTMQVAGNLGMVYMALGRYDEAERTSKRVVDVRTRLLGPEHPDTLISKNNVATVYQATGRYAEAKQILEEVLQTQTRRLGPEHVTTLTVNYNLARIYANLGQLHEAEQSYRDILETRRSILGEEHADTIVLYNDLVNLHIAQGRYDESLPLSQKALELHTKTLGEKHLHTLVAMNNRALSLHRKGKHDEAAPLYKDAIKKQRQALGEDHITTLQTLVNLGLLYLDQGKYDAAEPIHREAWERRQKVLGEDHSATLLSMSNLAGTWLYQGQAARANTLFQEALQRSRRSLGKAHQTTLMIAHELGVCFVRQSRLEEARAILEETYEARQQLLGQHNGYTQLTLRELTNTLLALGEFEAAEHHARRALAYMQEKAPKHYALPQTQSLLGAALAGQQAYQDAEPLLLEGFQGLSERTKDQPPHIRERLTADAARRLVSLYEAWGKKQESEIWRRLITDE